MQVVLYGCTVAVLLLGAIIELLVLPPEVVVSWRPSDFLVDKDIDHASLDGPCSLPEKLACALGAHERVGSSAQ